MSDAQRGSRIGAGLAGVVAVGGYAGCWYLGVQRAVDACVGTQSWCGFAEAIFMVVVGLPVAYVVWSLGLRAAGVANAWAAPLAMFIALWFLISLGAFLELPPAVWVVTAGALSSGWASIPGIGFALRRPSVAPPAR